MYLKGKNLIKLCLETFHVFFVFSLFHSVMLNKIYDLGMFTIESLDEVVRCQLLSERRQPLAAICSSHHPTTVGLSV